MAYDYEKAKKLYESLSPDKQQQFANDNSGHVQDFLKQYNAEKNQSTNTAQNTTQNTGSTVSGNTVSNNRYGQPTEYQPSGTNKPNSYVNQGEGNYTYNPSSGYYEKSQTSNSIRDKWDSLSYDEQQEKLRNNPNLKEGITKVGGTIKQSPYENQGEGNYQYNPKTGYYEKQGSQGGNGTPANKGWDYQDNSPERMAEILRNLDDLSKTNPGLFTDYDSFYNAFIAGKGRSQEQIDTLNDFFNRMKQYSKYDNLSSSDLGYGLAHGQPYEDYLSYLKYNDPQRYGEIQEARKAEEDKIKSDASMDTISSMTGEIDPTKTATGKVIEWLKAQGLFVDKDGNLIDDRTENYASEEELGYQKQIADINARNLDIDNTVKHTYDDLVEKYPGATKATLMAMAQDMNADLLREKENNLVELTRLQGYVGYMQQEREDRTQIGKDSISQLQKEYGMYYDYSPEGMSELAQAQYAATNVTLDQADNGTDTQKQMALDSVLSDYYDKYGSIIQRSKNQVINDVMAYAKKNGVSLSQALEDNFLKFLRQKPGFKQLNSVTSNPDVFKIGEDTYGYWDENGNLVPIGGNLGGGYNPTGGLFGYTDYTPITSQQLTNGIDKFMSQHPLNSDGGQCGSFVNDYLQSLGYDRLYDDPIDKKKAVTNSDTAVKGAIAVMDSKNYPQYGHTAIVTDVRGDKVHLLESNWGDDEKVHERWVNKSDILGYFDPSKSSTTPKDVLNNKFTGDPDWNQNGYFNSLVPYFNTVVKDGKIDLTDTKYKEALKDYGINSQEFNQMAQNYANSELKGTGGSQASRALEMAIKTYEYLYGPSSQEIGWMPNGSTWLGRQVSGLAPFSDVGKAKTEFESMLNRLTLKELFDAKALGATFGAMSKDEWDVLANAATDVKWGAGNFKENMEDLIESLYTATIDGNAQLPKNWDGSQAQNMVNNRITNGTSLGNYGNATTTRSSTSRFNAPTYVNNQSTLNGEIDWDSVWNQ